MEYDISVRHNALPYIQPYSVIITYNNKAEILGSYRNKNEAKIACYHFKKWINQGIKIKKIESKNLNPIESLEKRMENPDGDKVPIIKDKNKLKRKIEIRDKK